MSHKAGGYPESGPQYAILGALGHIEKVTGRRPPTCPWRSFYDPIVQEVIAVMLHSRAGTAMAKLGDDPPAILLDALEIYIAAREATERHYRELEAKQNKKGR